MVKIYVCAVHAHMRWLASETEVGVFAPFLSVELLRLRMISSNDSMRVYMINVGTACACEQPPPPFPPPPPFLPPALCADVSGAVCHISVCDNGFLWSVLFQCGSQPSALEEDASNWASHEREERRQTQRLPPKYSFYKHSYGYRNKKEHFDRPCRSLPRPPVASSSVHTFTAHLSSRPCLLYAFLSSVPSIGQVQSEGLAQLRLSHLISKSCLFHLSKCLRSELLYAKDKGCLLSTEDWLFHPPSPACSWIYTSARRMQNYLWGDYIFLREYFV